MELEGLQSDIDSLKSRVHEYKEFHVVLLEDMNVGPTELGGHDVAMAGRRRLWSKIITTNNLVLANPLAMSDQPQDVWLPIREKHVQVGYGCTHHCPGRGKAIDIVASLGQVAVQLIVHNGLHCKHSGDCNWDACTEYTCGDHFLVEGLIENVHVDAVEAASSRMPHWWNDLGSWEKGLAKSASFLHTFNGS